MKIESDELYANFYSLCMSDEAGLNYLSIHVALISGEQAIMMQEKIDSGSTSARPDAQYFSSRREISGDSARQAALTQSKKEAATLKDLQKCGGYVYFLTVTYAMMAFSQTINLIFMTFAGELLLMIPLKICSPQLEVN